MLILVTYDVSTVEKAGQRRLRRVAQACEDYGVRVQKSVFECQVGQMEWVSLRDRLLREIKDDKDSLRFYFLDDKAVQRIEHHGVAKPLDLTEALVL
jgi:CRISPR-associated protein Cas2